MKSSSAASLFILLAISATSAAQEYNGIFTPQAEHTTDRLIVKWKEAEPSIPSGDARRQKINQMSTRARIGVRSKIQITSKLEVLQLDERRSGGALQEVLELLADDPAIEFVSPDLRRHAHALPNDTLAVDQWYLLNEQVAALRAEQAWDVTTGSTGTVVAVLDTGVRFDHPDLLAAAAGGKLLPGYDFISGESASQFFTASDGNGRDADPADPGDWVSAEDLDQPGFDDCEQRSSSWHGTRVASLIAAKTNNSAGIAGASWNTWILPVRVLGKCGGYDSDIIAALRWSAGLEVSGAPNNPFPAKVINLSLGGDRSCTAAYQSVASELAARGVLIVASAGNEGGPVSAPASCAGVLGVAGIRHAGTKVGFSNLGPSVGIAAPGGNCVTTGPGQPCLFSIVTATDRGSTAPAGPSYTDQFNFNVGTSFSAPMVSGVAALMHAVNGRLSSQHLIARLKSSATPFPANPNTGIPDCRVPTSPTDIQDSECYCTTSTCGAGMVNAQAGVSEALRPVVSIQVPAAISPGQDVTFDGSASSAACDRSLTTYQWTVLSSSITPAPGLASSSEASVTVRAPASGEFTLRLTVTDNIGAQDFADVTVQPNDASTTALPLTTAAACPVLIAGQIATSPTPPPPSTPSPTTTGRSSGGGGGGMGWEVLVLAFFACRKRVGGTNSMTDG